MPNKNRRPELPEVPALTAVCIVMAAIALIVALIALIVALMVNPSTKITGPLTAVIIALGFFIWRTLN
jgi:hypothetical protein